MKKFFGVIGNPPYNQDRSLSGDNSNYSPPIYNYFLDSSFEVGERVELIHPARFLLNAGRTPKEWNEKMLADPHYSILLYEGDSSKVFGNTSITGGVVVSYHDETRKMGPIGVFTPFPELNGILKKVQNAEDFESLTEVIFIQSRFDLETLLEAHPEVKSGIGSDGRDSRFEKNIFTKVPIFTEKRANEDDVRTLGIHERKRAWRFIPREFVDESQDNLDRYKVIMSVSNGAAGNLGDSSVRLIGEPVIGLPGDGYTRSFIGIGAFATKSEAENCATFLRTKFARVMVGILKTTQMLNKDVWLYVPNQDFKTNADIDWSKSISEIDQQLYAKYELDQDEVDFIEMHVAYLKEV